MELVKIDVQLMLIIKPEGSVIMQEVKMNQFPDKAEFLKNLKVKAGFNPSYWSNNIKVYRFRTVEINDED